MYVQKAKFKNVKTILKRIFSFLCNYWMIFGVFLLFGIIFNEPFPTLGRLLLQCFGISTATVFNWDYFNAIHPVFAWYVSFYILFIVISPLLAKICKHNFFIDLLMVSSVLFGLNFLAFTILPDGMTTIRILIATFATWGHIGMIGFVFAKYNVFDFFHNMLSKYLCDMVQVILCILVLYHIFHLWTVEGKIYIYESEIIKVSYFAIFTPVFIYAVTYIIKYINCKIINSILISLSKESTNMWFLHGLFFTPKKTIQWIAYLPRYSLLILVWTLLLTYCCSKGVSYFIELFRSGVQKMMSVIKNICLK